ncbi:N-acetyltransferase [Microbacterium sp. NEAU-LLC]|uniref:N-acetyltransferase n=1 Tax=Microbacterium helvum TaxID=2773713 RepID=A0ABR8NT59_9MICO|nr:N-acetyltransferase [Microbacterium helvum]MBD3943820.1 N-acetyltransferase [Microbacterium helvum]
MSFTDPTEPVPAELRTDEFTLRPITPDDAARDYDAVMETRAELRLWEQSDWPADDFTVDDNRTDLVDLQSRHDAHRAFTYTVVDPAGTGTLGCVYIFPTTATFLARSTVTPLAGDAWNDVDADVYFWVRRSRIADRLDERLLTALRSWFAGEWGFARTVFVTSERFAQQVALLEGTDLTVRFELREPDKAGTYLVYG